MNYFKRWWEQEKADWKKGNPTVVQFLGGIVVSGVILGLFKWKREQV